MNLIHTTLTAYQLTLTESEVQAAIADPADLVRFLKAEYDHQMGYDELPALRKAMKARKGKSLEQLRQAAAAIGKQPCPRCGQRIAAAYMALHLRRKHAEGLQLEDEPL
jgi:hypothetical protein